MSRILRWFTLSMVLFSTLILFAQDTLPPERLYLVNADGSNIQQVLADPNTIYWGPGWSHDGTSIAVTVATVGTIGGETRLTNNAR